MPSTATVASRPTKTLSAELPTPEADIEHWFSDFRESAVRLAERVTDLRGPPSDPLTTAQGDLKIIRSIFGKWSADVLLALHAVPSIGFEELRRGLPNISPRVLSLKLKELEQNSMVRRQILDTRPPRVRYSLTERGWTVAWLAQPILLYLRMTADGRRLGDGPAAPPNAV
ncbi:MAG: winged helix-turn-helix transcriptional regulator [Thermoplasmata archaeon]|nr:winged helix-turn-helix transcriptional regulator [Thermoplasmata archaeon]